MLHILSETPLDPTILERTATGDTILLIEDAVIDALAAGPFSQLWKDSQPQQKIFVLSADIDIRGIKAEALVSGISIIDYKDFVRLTMANKVIYSWH